MPFFASRNVEPAPTPVPNGAEPAQPGLPPFMEAALQRLMQSAMPQIKPLVEQLETAVLAARDELRQVREGQESMRRELAWLSKLNKERTGDDGSV